MTNSARLLGFIFAALMGIFSLYMYWQTGDWVAAVFCLGSVAYGVYFASSRQGS
jgi:hypothetical protein